MVDIVGYDTKKYRNKIEIHMCEICKMWNYEIK